MCWVPPSFFLGSNCSWCASMLERRDRTYPLPPFVLFLFVVLRFGVSSVRPLDPSFQIQLQKILHKTYLFEFLQKEPDCLRFQSSCAILLLLAASDFSSVFQVRLLPLENLHHSLTIIVNEQNVPNNSFSIFTAFFSTFLRLYNSSLLSSKYSSWGLCRRVLRGAILKIIDPTLYDSISR